MSKRIVPPDDELKMLYDRGMSAAEIGRFLGINKNTIISAMSRLKISTRSPIETRRLQTERGVGPRPARYWLGKKQPSDMVERRVSKIRGENHYMWKGGLERRPYRAMAQKDKCERCGARQNLCLHHTNFDHYDDRPENLTVYCLSCHMSVHKKRYWDAIHAGEEPPKGNAPIGWRREVKSEATLP